MNTKERCPGWGEGYADCAGVEKRHDRYVENRGCGLVSAVSWVLAGLVLMVAMAARAS